MSSVRMCDNCGITFSENADGWANMNGNKAVKDENGKTKFVTISMDYCPECVIVQQGGQQASANVTRTLATETERKSINGGNNGS